MNQNTNPKKPLSSINNLSSFILHSLSPNYSTTKLLTRPFDDIVEFDEQGRIKEEYKFKINHPKFNIQNSRFIGNPGDKFETLLFLPPGEGRQGEGGLRTKGYFKFSYVRREMLDVKGEVLEVRRETLPPLTSHESNWWIADHDGHPILPCDFSNISSHVLPLTSHVLPLITIITVVYNGAKYLEETIQSVINQTYPNVEYIIIDGGSTDGTLDIIKKYEEYIDYWVSEKDKGIYDAMNKGIDLAGGKWINFMNAGDGFWKEDVIEKVFLGKEYENVGVVYGDTIVNYGNFIKKIESYEINSMFYIMPFCHQSCFILSNYMKKFKYDTKFKLAADFDFFVSLFNNRVQFKKTLFPFSNVLHQGLSDKNRVQVLNEYRESLKKYGLLSNKVILFYDKKIMIEHIKRLIKKILPQLFIKFIIRKLK